jgi:hypothetical protein
VSVVETLATFCDFWSQRSTNEKGLGSRCGTLQYVGEPTTRELIHVVELSVKSFVSTVEVPRSLLKLYLTTYCLCLAMCLSCLAQSLRLRVITDYPLYDDK